MKSIGFAVATGIGVIGAVFSLAYFILIFATLVGRADSTALGNNGGMI